MQCSLVNTDLLTKMHSATYQETIILNTKIFSVPQLTEYIMVMCKWLFSPPKHTNQPWYPPSLLFDGYWNSFLGVLWAGHKVYHSPPSSAQVTNEWSYTSAPPACLQGVDSDHHLFVAFSMFTYLNSEPTDNLIRSHMLLARPVILFTKTYNRNTVCPHCQW